MQFLLFWAWTDVETVLWSGVAWLGRGFERWQPAWHKPTWENMDMTYQKLT